MKNIYKVIFLLIILCGCQGASKNADDVLNDFIAKSDSPLLKLSRENGEDLEYTFEGIQEKNGKTLSLYKIGHTEKEEDGSNPRFVYDCWVMLETNNLDLYVYDIVDDSLIKWSE